MTNAELKAAIQAAVYENTEGAITGTALQEVLLAMVDTMGLPVIKFTSNPEYIYSSAYSSVEDFAAGAGLSLETAQKIVNNDINLAIIEVAGQRQFVSNNRTQSETLLYVARAYKHNGIWNEIEVYLNQGTIYYWGPHVSA